MFIMATEAYLGQTVRSLTMPIGKPKFKYPSHM